MQDIQVSGIQITFCNTNISDNTSVTKSQININNIVVSRYLINEVIEEHRKNVQLQN